MFQTFTEMEGLPFEVQSFQNFEDARAWLGAELHKAGDLKIDSDQKIIKKTLTGELYTNRSLNLVRELSVLVNTHRGYNVLMDLRATVTRPAMLDLMAIASECTKLKSDFNNRIAFLIPDTEDRLGFAKLFRTCMEAQGFKFQQFSDDDAALAWLKTDS